MKRILSLSFVLIFLFVAGCGPQVKTKKEEAVVGEEFMLNSIKWGSSWENIKDNPKLSGYNIIRDEENIFAVEISEFEYLGQQGKLIMMFSNLESSFPASGFVQAYFVYDDTVEKELIKKGEEVYGERKDFFLDKQGIENPLNPSAWYSPETLDGSLSETEKQEYLKRFEGENYEASYIDAILRGPLVIISVNEDNNRMLFQGSDAAVVENLRNKE